MTAFRLTVLGLVALLALGYLGLRQASTAANTVPETRAGVAILNVYPDDLAPSECAALYLDEVIYGAGSFNGSKSADLILGSPASDDIAARQGDDCIVGGAGNDDIDGGQGKDVCIGGPGTDTFKNCEVKVQ